MRSTISKILKQVTNTSVAVALGAMTFVGGAASAETVQQRAQAEMNNGKDYAAAHQIASREVGALYSPELAANRQSAEAAMNQGKDYIAAWETTSHQIGTFFSPEQVAKAKQVQDELNQGKDYVAAWDATREEQPVVEVSEAGQVTAKREVTRSKK